MDKQNLRFLLLLAIFAIGMLLYNAWQIEHAPAPAARVAAAPAATGTVTAGDIDLPIAPQSPAVTTTEPAFANGIGLPAEAAGSAARAQISQDRQVEVQTDVFNLIIDLIGGDIVYLNLPQYPQTLVDQNKGFTLLDNSAERFYVAQSGLLNDAGPDSSQLGRAKYSSKQSKYRLVGDKLQVDLNYKTANGVEITKRFNFTKGSYVIAVEYLVFNRGDELYQASLFGRLRRAKPTGQESSILNPMRTYTGAAVHTEETQYKKISFDDMESKPFKQYVEGGWAAVIEHYFTSAWIPSQQQKNYFQSEAFVDQSFGIGFIGKQILIKPGDKVTVSAQLYLGPRVTDTLKQLAPGLDLTVDYGVLWWLCQPLFWLLKELYALVGNWGAAIILIVCTIKLAFFRLSAASYRSMGNMKKLQPRIEELKKRFADDRQQFSQAVMELYRRERVNPFGGCLPILIQIPVFIALYYVLLESVELRHAPFALWIHDLSAKDPFYVLPLIMGASMLLQQKMNPAPADPIQAKVMLAMPIVFTVLFLNFPAGLVLYWVVNNILSITQQWYITRRINGNNGKAVVSKVVAEKK